MEFISYFILYASILYLLRAAYYIVGVLMFDLIKKFDTEDAIMSLISISYILSFLTCM